MFYCVYSSDDDYLPLSSNSDGSEVVHKKSGDEIDTVRDQPGEKDIHDQPGVDN